jgi:RNA polymerase primary sigma factor
MTMRTASPQAARRDVSALARYSREIARIPVLDKVAESALGARIRAGDRLAVDELVRHNLRFVVSIAKRYVRHGVPLEDLIDEGNIGLIRGLARAGECLPHALGREPTIEETARWTGFPPRRIERLRQIPLRALSIDGSAAATGEEAAFDMHALEDPRAQEFERVERDIDNQRLRSYLQRLDRRGADVVRRYYGLLGDDPETLEAIGRSYGVTRERVRQLRDRAMDDLRALLECEPVVLGK